MQNRTNLGRRVLVHPNEAWMFAIYDIAIKIPKCTKYEINVYNVIIFLIYFPYFKFLFHFNGH